LYIYSIDELVEFVKLAHKLLRKQCTPSCNPLNP